MSPSKFFLAPREPRIRRPIRRKHRAPLAWERLEPRQLLSTWAIGPSTASTLVRPFVQASPMAGAGSTAYSPQQIATAYEINGISFSGVSGNGAGQTIAIVDAYRDPNIQADLAAFDAHFGLSAPPSFTVDNLGASTTDPGWSLETALDVEWAHAVAPKANIVLVEASPEEILPGQAPGSSPETEPMLPSSDCLDSALGKVEAATARLLPNDPARFQPVEEYCEEQSVRIAGEDGGAAPALVAAGAIVVLGRRVLTERGRRRRTSSGVASIKRPMSEMCGALVQEKRGAPEAIWSRIPLTST